CGAGRGSGTREYRVTFARLEDWAAHHGWLGFRVDSSGRPAPQLPSRRNFRGSSLGERKGTKAQIDERRRALDAVLFWDMAGSPGLRRVRPIQDVVSWNYQQRTWPQQSRPISHASSDARQRPT